MSTETLSSVFRTTRVDTLYADVADVAKEEDAGNNIFVLFTSDVGADGQTWCPDCARAFPVVSRLAGAQGRTLVVCEVGTLRAWKDASHPFRHDENLRLSSIPTLISVERSNAEKFTVRKTLEGSLLERCTTAQDVEDLVKPFLT